MGPKTRKSFDSKRLDYVGSSRDLILSELPTLRSVLRLGQLIMEREESKLDENLGHLPISIQDMGKEVCARILTQYAKANVKFVPPVILDEKSIIQKVFVARNDVGNILRKQKGCA